MELVGQTIIIGDLSQDLAQDSVVTLVAVTNKEYKCVQRFQ